MLVYFNFNQFCWRGSVFMGELVHQCFTTNKKIKGSRTLEALKSHIVF